MCFSFRPLLIVGAVSLLVSSCNSAPSESNNSAPVSAATLLTPGPWRGELAAQGQKIPFLFEVKTEATKPVLYLINKGLNGEERLRCDEISAAGDSVTVRLHVFDAALVLRAAGQGKLTGTWVKYDAKTPYRVPLAATAGARPLFPVSERNSRAEFGGTWRATFQDGDGTSYPAVGIFQQKNGTLAGTFLTSTGDYRYLSGDVDGQELRLSTFDGSHAYLFTASRTLPGPLDITKEYAANTLFGNFYAGKSGHETWTATPDPAAKLPDADTLTYLKKGETRLNFKFPNVFAGGSISPTDPKYRGKVLVLQILGSWCPNCLDESNFLAPWYEKNKQRGVEIIGLGYERSPDYAVAAARLRNLKTRLGIGYDLAVAGVSNKDSVARSLPQLAKFLAFPTTIFIDKKGVVRSIHTGFSGPGTGAYYTEEKARFERTVARLLAE